MGSPDEWTTFRPWGGGADPFFPEDLAALSFGLLSAIWALWLGTLTLAANLALSLMGLIIENLERSS